MKFLTTKHLKSLMLIFIGSLLLSSCKKKESGVCYCSYFSGDKKEYNLSSLSRSQQVDSCYVLDNYAEPFAGDCELK